MERISHQRKIEKARNFAKNMFYFITLILTLFFGYYLGFYSYKFKTQQKPIQIETVLKKNINLGIDDKNNFIIINRINGTCIIFEDSVGYSIFNIYAKKIVNK